MADQPIGRKADVKPVKIGMNGVPRFDARDAFCYNPAVLPSCLNILLGPVALAAAPAVEMIQLAFDEGVRL